VTFVALNYGSLFTSRKQAQTAVDSATLAVAQELSNVTVDGTAFGRVGVVDQYPKGKGLTVAPVFGINTLAARARLDFLIAKSLNNTTMQVLAKADLAEVDKASKKLRDILVTAKQGSITYSDANGDSKTVNLKQLATTAFNTSSARINTVADVASKDIELELGTMSGQIVSNIPIPRPTNKGLDGASNISAQYRGSDGKDNTYYLANVPVPVGDKNITLAYLGDQPELVDRNSFKAVEDATNVIPTVVRLTVHEQVQAPATGREKPIKSTKTEIACAVAGGPRVQPTRNIFRLEFPQGLPGNDPNGLPGTADATWDTVAGIMNASQIDSVNGEGAGDGNWNGKGGYFTAQGGPFPGPGSTIVPSDVFGRTKDDPSVALSAYVYDWLRNDGLRPNIDEVTKAFRNLDLRKSTPGNPSLASAHDIFMPSAYAECAVGQCNVYGAIFTLESDSTKAMFGPATNTVNGITYVGDPRSLMNFSRDTNSYMNQAMVFRMQASIPQQLGWVTDPTVMAYGRDNNGRVSTVDCNPIEDLLDYRQALINTMFRARDVATAGVTVDTDAKNELRPLVAEYNRLTNEANAIAAQAAIASFNGNQALYNQLSNDYDAKLAERNVVSDKMKPWQKMESRGMAARANGVVCFQDTVAAVNRMLNVTSRGCQKFSDTHYLLGKNFGSGSGGVHFFGAGPSGDYTPSDAAQDQGTWVALIKGDGKVDTKQDSGASGGRSWTGGAQDDPSGVPDFINNSSLNAITRSTCSSIPTSQILNFKFVGSGDASFSEGGGTVQVSVVGGADQENTWKLPKDGSGNILDATEWVQYVRNNGRFEQVTGISALLEGQSQYQALNVYKEKVANSTINGKPLYMTWSIMAQNNVRNPGSSDAHSAEAPGNTLNCIGAPGEGNQKACDAEGIRFQVTSPSLEVPDKYPEIRIPPPPPGLPPLVATQSFPPPPPPPASHH
jgi:hypothetical protein